MHRTASKALGIALAIVCYTATTVALGRDSAPQTGRGTHQDYQVPAGTYLAIELRTNLSSNSNSVGDPVDGRLLMALTADGVELVPAGATVLGTVSEVEPAGKKKQGRLAFAFHIIEHPKTGSRATIRGTVLNFASDSPKKGNVYPEVRLDKGLDASVSLLAPLKVRIPRARPR